MKKILILNTGGTFSKTYDAKMGSLVIKENNDAVFEIISGLYKQSAKDLDIAVSGLLYKDSLDITDSDREELVERITRSSVEFVVVIHGTDTMDKSAEFLNDANLTGKTVVFTGAMVPYSINQLEASCNLAQALLFVETIETHGVFVVMNGYAGSFKEIKKNFKMGRFERNSLN